jgi:Domain of unknown function (DUF4288)
MQSLQNPQVKKYRFVATIIMRCRVGDNQKDNWLYDEQVCVIKAEDEDRAYVKATKLAKRKEHNYLNEFGETVYWEFMGLAELSYLEDDAIRDGTEIRSRLFHSDDPKALVIPKEKYDIFPGRTERENSEQLELEAVS